eukprot:10817530-Alexandrium_andersonii.AAC.1
MEVIDYPPDSPPGLCSRGPRRGPFATSRPGAASVISPASHRGGRRTGATDKRAAIWRRATA